MNSGARKAPAVSGSITIDSSGMPMIAKPPPNPPFMKAIRKVAASATTMVKNVSSKDLSISRDVAVPVKDIEEPAARTIPVVPASRHSTVAETDCTEINLHRVQSGALGLRRPHARTDQLWRRKDAAP